MPLNATFINTHFTSYIDASTSIIPLLWWVIIQNLRLGEWIYLNFEISYELRDLIERYVTINQYLKIPRNDYEDIMNRFQIPHTIYTDPPNSRDRIQYLLLIISTLIIFY